MSPGRRLDFLRSPIVAVMATLAVGACATKPPPVAEPVVASVSPVEKPPPVLRLLPPKPVDLHWAFTNAPDACTANATGPGGSFQIQTTATRQILVTASFSATRRLPGSRSRAKLAFRGPAGNWTLPGTWRHGQFTSTRPLDERGVASVLGLLAGGTAAVTAGASALGAARLPPSGEEGTAWVQCPKQMIAIP